MYRGSVLSLKGSSESVVAKPKVVMGHYPKGILETPKGILEPPKGTVPFGKCLARTLQRVCEYKIPTHRCTLLVSD